jgi:hypothetical protein
MLPATVCVLVVLVSGESPEPKCGAERQRVKTLTDGDARDVNSEPKHATVEELVALQAPLFHEDRPRNTVEKTVYAVTANVVGFKLEAGDGDFHVVIAGESGATMIVEFPAPECTRGAADAQRMAEARKTFAEEFGKPMRGVYRKLAEPIRAKLLGVGFFDLLHRQTGVAPNGIELHPVLRVERIQVSPSRAAP